MIRQHEALRVPQGWKGQDKALVIQLERVFNDLYKVFSNLDASVVTNVAYDSVTQKLTLTINGTTSDIARIATLDGNGKIPASQLPSYVDDLEEYDTLSDFPATGEADKIYVAKDTGFTYRWSGTQYVRLNTYDEATQSNSGLMSASDKTKLDGIENGANNYSLPLSADGTRGGIQVGYTENNKKYAVKLDNEKAYVEVPWNDTKNSAGTMNRVNKKLYIVGAETQATNPTTNSNANVYIGDDNCLYSNGTKVLTDHQDISGKADKATTVTDVAYDSTNKKITKTINGTTTDVVPVSSIKSALGSFTWGALAGQ